MAWPSKNPDDYMENAPKRVRPAPPRLARAFQSLVFGACTLGITQSFVPGVRGLIAVVGGVALFGLSELEARRRGRGAG